MGDLLLPLRQPLYLPQCLSSRRGSCFSFKFLNPPRPNRRKISTYRSRNRSDAHKRISFPKFGLNKPAGTRRHAAMNKLAPRFLLGLSLAVLPFAGSTQVAITKLTLPPSPTNSGPDPADANMAPVQVPSPNRLLLRPRHTPHIKLGNRPQAIRSAASAAIRSPATSPSIPTRSDRASTTPPDDQTTRPIRTPPRPTTSSTQEGQSPPVELRRPAPTAPPRLRPARSPRAQLHLDPRLLVLGSRRLLLDPRRLVRSALLRSPLDPRILGLVPRSLGLPPRLLGTPHRLLRRHQLRLRLHRRRLSRRLLERK